jgi:Leucine-rich repeat (LRR) protein
MQQMVNRSACEEGCQVPAVACTGSSSNLVHADCFNWISTVRSSSYFAKANPPACQELSHLGDPCSCTGVIGCSGGRITSVLLARRGLAFNASDESSLGLLDGLQHIAMYSDALTGPVPKWLFNLASLKYVSLDNNRLTGTVPTELGALRGLNHLDFAYNDQLTGTVPTELGALSVLNQLNFQNNQLTGTVPTELGTLTELTRLSFNRNQLTGTVPTELGALTELTHLVFDNNQLTGTVPALPFKRYTANCCMSPNNFSCPLPVDAAACICNGKPGVVCN